jgi:hypothetical protein
MKRLSILALSIIILLSACKKSVDNPEDPNHQKAVYYVGAIKGTDTVFTPGMWARAETVGIVIAEDDKLKAELIAYQNIGGMAHYKLKITNKTDCQRILRWGWEELGLISIQPDDNTANTAQSDVLAPNEIKYYTAIGLPKMGRIKVQAQKSNSDCPNSSTLIIDITMDILPVTYLKHKASYKDGVVTLAFTVDDPNEVDTYVILRQYDGPRELIYQFTSDKKTTSYSIPIFAEERK